jgi:hypothetical protein
MLDLLFTILSLTIALVFTRYIAYYIVYFFAKFIEFVSRGNINMILHPITFGDILCTAIIGLMMSSIFKIVGII